MTHKEALKKTRNYMYWKLGWDVTYQNGVLADYAKSKGLEPLPLTDSAISNKRKRFWAALCADIQNGNWKDFHNFMLKYPRKKRPKRVRRQSYNEWWQQCNMDGTFAYNNSADDF